MVYCPLGKALGIESDVSILDIENDIPKYWGTVPGFWKDKKFSKEHCDALSVMASNWKRTPEHLEALHEGRRNSKNSPAHMAAIRKSRKGHIQTEEQKRKESESRLKRDDLSELSSIAGKASAANRKKSGYYQSEEWKIACAKGWETRRRKKEGLVNGD